ncbi:type IV pilus assembly protein PilM [Schumannella luteola]
MSSLVGVDIGSASVRAVEVRSPDKRPSIVKYAEVPLPEGSVRRGEVLEIATVATALKRLWANGKFSTKEVVLGMGGPRVLSRDLAVPRAPMDQIRESLPFHVQDLLPVPVNEALLDFYPISEGSGENGPVVNGLLVAAIKEAVNANVAAVTRAGLRPVGVDLIPFALVRGLLPNGGSRGLIAVVSIGANTTNVVLVQDGVPHFVRIIPAGGDDITRALVQRLQLSPGQAETAKRELGLTQSPPRPEHRPAADIIFEVAGEQVNAIRNTLAYFVNAKPGTSIERIVLSGGGSQLQGLARALSDLSGIPVVPSEPVGGAVLPREKVRATREQHDALTTAYALALGGVA